MIFVMDNLEKVVNYFNENIVGDFEVVFYGSAIEDKSENKDIDVCIISKDNLFNNEFILKYKKFLLENNFLLDEEIRYEDKLFVTEKEFLKIIYEYGEDNDKFSKEICLNNRYNDAKERVLFNILTTKVKLFGNKKIYENLSELAWEKLINIFKKNNKKFTFDNFVEYFKISKDYKKYYGYNIKHLNYFYNRFTKYFTKDVVIANLKDNVLKFPNKVAVLSEEKNLTYKEFDELSDKIAIELKKFAKNYCIVDYPHSLELIIIIYGIYKAGKTYVPVDYYAPFFEKSLIIDNFDDKIYLSDNKSSDLNIFEILNFENIDEDKKYLDYDFKENDILYIIHTSGTTGKPKGVMVSRKNLKYLIEAIQDFAPVDENSVYLFSTRNTFDVSISEIFGFLKNSASVYVYSMKNSLFFKKISSIIEKEKITHIAMSPSGLKILLKNLSDTDINKLNENVKYYMIAGEEFRIDLLDIINKKIKNSKIFNVYGPTECSVYATYYEVCGNEKDVVPIGKPLKGVDYIIEDDELLISGEGVSLGYYKNEEITNEKFKFINGIRYYLTGDLVYLKNNDLVYRCRKDKQVQIRGIRVELSDILNNIKNIVDIENKREIEIVYDNEQLILFYTGSEIKDFYNILKDKMSSYKIPVRFIRIDEFPLNSSGKKDFKLLLKNLNETYISNTFEENDIISKIRQIVFKYTQKINDDDLIYNKGVDSLSSVELLIEIEKYFKIDFNDISIYELGSINGINNFINEYIKNDINVDLHLENLSFDILNNNSNKKVISTYPLYYYARIYKTLNFNSIIYDKFEISKNQNYEDIYHKLDKIEVLKSFINIQKGVFELRDVSVNISKIYSKNIDIDLYEELSNFVLKNRDTNDYLYKIIYLYNENRAKIYFAFDHCIFDKSCVDVLKKIIFTENFDILNYSDFINLIIENNTKERMKLELEKYNIDNGISKIFLNFKDEIEIEELNYFSSNINDVYTEAIFYLKDNLFKKYEIKKAKINLIYNFRKLKNTDLSHVIGDIHTGVIYIYDEKNDIVESFNETIDYYQETAFTPKYYGYRNFPNLTDEDKEYNRIFDDEVYISINYLGVLSKTDLEDVKKSYEISKKEVNKLNSNKLNITLYIVNDKIYMFLSKKIV